MQAYQRTFIELALKSQALRFGEFTLKSGRVSPYFFNVGQLNSGDVLSELGKCYAAALQEAKIAYDVIFGPAYKGIPLVCATAMACHVQYQQSLAYSFNRKEVKNHGEGGQIIGANLAHQRVLIIDDVITAGTAMRESFHLVHAANGVVSGIIVALDRQERGQNTLSAIQEIETIYHVPVKAIITFADILAFAKNQPEFSEFAPKMEEYRDQYGVSSSHLEICR